MNQTHDRLSDSGLSLKLVLVNYTEEVYVKTKTEVPLNPNST